MFPLLAVWAEPSIHSAIHPSTSPSILLSVCLSVHPSAPLPPSPSVHQSIHPATTTSILPFIHLIIRPTSVNQSTHDILFCPYIHQSIIHPSIYLLLHSSLSPTIYQINRSIQHVEYRLCILHFYPSGGVVDLVLWSNVLNCSRMCCHWTTQHSDWSCFILMKWFEARSFRDPSFFTAVHREGPPPQTSLTRLCAVNLGRGNIQPPGLSSFQFYPLFMQTTVISILSTLHSGSFLAGAEGESSKDETVAWFQPWKRLPHKRRNAALIFLPVPRCQGSMSQNASFSPSAFYLVMFFCFFFPLASLQSATKLCKKQQLFSICYC